MRVWSNGGGLTLAAISGLLLGLSFPPADFSWVIWFGLAPLLWAVRQANRPAHALLYGLATGLVLYLITTYPSTSAHSWAGWQSAASAEEHEAFLSEQQVKLHLLWIGMSLWGALFWMLSAWILAQLAGRSLWRMALVAPPLLIVVTEWLRSKTSFDYQWAFLGNAAVDAPGIIQLGSLGGVWLLSWLVILVNVGLLAWLSRPKGREWALPATMAALWLVASVWGIFYAQKLDEDWSQREKVRVAAIQHHHSRYTPEHYTGLGIERDYLDLMQQVARGDIGEVQLLVLPESIAFATLSLDRTRVESVPEQVHQSREDWEDAMRWIIEQSDNSLAIILGVDTVEQSRMYNSMTFWTRRGLVHHYHKQNLVPFAEYQPDVLKFLDFSGQAQFTAGRDSATGELHGIPIGSFICQEVLTPAVLRRSVLAGAEILVSGGNDGVFANPAMAQVHAKLARLRAVESRRYVVRAMKTGISAIISPTGTVLTQSPSAEPYVIVGGVAGNNVSTLFIRFGNWPVGLAMIILLATGGLLVAGGTCQKPRVRHLMRNSN